MSKEPFKGSTRNERFPANWEAIRMKILVRDNRVCKLAYPGCTERATDVDHIDNDSDNNRLGNLQAVCKECHYKKSGEYGRSLQTRYSPHEETKSPGYIVKEESESFKKPVNTKAKIQETGPMWDRDETGAFVFPKYSIGPQVVFWITQNLQINGEPFRLTGEQIRFIMWFYAIDENGKWLYKRGFKFAPKGWGKDPLGAALLAVELVGPCRFKEWDTKGNPTARDEPRAWCQVAAVTMGQNKNTFIYLKDIFTSKAIQKYQIEFNEDTIYAYNRARMCEKVTSASRGLEGNFPTFCLCSETEHWIASKGLVKLWDVLNRNLRKVPNSHLMSINNVYDPAEDSIAQRQLEAYEDYVEGRAKNPKILIDFKGTTDAADFTDYDERRKLISEVYGESSAWIDIDNICDEFDDVTIPMSQNIQFYGNAIGIDKNTWVDIRNWDACGVDINVPKSSRIVLSFDGSLNDDSTALVGMVVGGKYDKTIFTIGVWQKPPKSHGNSKDWFAPREEISKVVDETFLHYRVLAFWADPSHKKDEGGANYWLPLIQKWHNKYSRKIPGTFWASKNNAFNWDMTSSMRQREFVEGLGMLEQEISDNTIKHDKNKDMRKHIQNARRMKGQFGFTIGKNSRQSPDKIDLAVCAGIAYTLYTAVTGSRFTRKTDLNSNQKEIDNG